MDFAKKAFVAYLTAGDPSLAMTARYVRALARAGADIIELGVPHSDPVADGETNQRAAERGLKSGTTLIGILDMARKLRAEGEKVPLVLFSYFNPILRLGLVEFARLARASGITAVLAVDLPPEESKEYREALLASGVGTVFLASPTTRVDRLALIGEASTEFVYYVSRAGVTGTRDSLSATLAEEVARVKAIVKKPVCVGFGISTPEQVREVASIADGVVVGSALVKVIEENPDEAEKKLGELVRTLRRDLC